MTHLHLESHIQCTKIETEEYHSPVKFRVECLKLIVVTCFTNTIDNSVSVFQSMAQRSEKNYSTLKFFSDYSNSLELDPRGGGGGGGEANH